MPLEQICSTPYKPLVWMNVITDALDSLEMLMVRNENVVLDDKKNACKLVHRGLYVFILIKSHVKTESV